ncbi:SAM-dependent methyltransferase [Corynebacterium yudongzhengii]|uniref:Class I SAM-dependent methyltransferase n=1 Tax=Corynebacterium yudongzhengii TaxID=2080740 RepID=A0A2U1T8C8_9CORY|nr:class I SAM-dependent methyltransferase [Corynebacterium yudongzhengii]AWB83056.1 SAM-dependent methyltransferase [Corynebacterium yudongzhengii]PWC02225.1 class I SAM-dependent methyltransferase [Corynebacterium yudongzhengii]
MLLRSFRYEQTAPAQFYRPLAEDTARLISALSGDITGEDLKEKTVLDVGGGPGYFAEAFERRGARYLGLEPDVGEMAAAGISLSTSVRGDGTALPFRTHSLDIAYSSNVAEHVPDFTALGDEMVRVTRPGGLVVLSYTVWLGPFGGHETGLWPHYVGGEYARRRYERLHGRPPKNVWGTSLFDVSCSDGLRWAQSLEDRGLALIELCFPRYHPAWAWWMVRIPGLREFFVSNLVIVARVSKW